MTTLTTLLSFNRRRARRSEGPAPIPHAVLAHEYAHRTPNDPRLHLPAHHSTR